MKKKPQSAFEQYFLSLSDEDKRALSAFFREISAHCDLEKGEKELLREDFENAIIYYISIGLPLYEALERLAVENLGGFYVRPPVLWYALDDAAKVYPMSMQHGRMAVFRLAVRLKEPVVPELLQMALTFTIKRFPTFATTVKKGFFWHYLDTAKRRYGISPETDMPCRPLKVSRSGSQSFRVQYYENRVSVEFFHVLTDGTGGMAFLKALTAEYLRLMGVYWEKDASLWEVNDAPSAAEFRNEFASVEKTAHASGFVDKPALQMSGSLSRSKPCQVLHFKMDAASLKRAAEKYGATVTAYVLALMFLAGKAATDELEGEVNIQVPVNMRKFYPSVTVRNFAMYCGIRLSQRDIADVGSIVGEISRQLTEKASKEAMREMLTATEKLVGILRFIPLAVKAPAARVVYGFLGDRIFSNTLSNLGVVKLPRELSEHILSMDFVLGTAITNRAGCSMVTFGNIATLSIAKLTADPTFEERLYALLESDEVEVCVEGSEKRED